MDVPLRKGARLVRRTLVAASLLATLPSWAQGTAHPVDGGRALATDGGIDGGLVADAGDGDAAASAPTDPAPEPAPPTESAASDPPSETAVASEAVPVAVHPPAELRFHDRTLFVIRAARGELLPADRARAASRALKSAVAVGEGEEIAKAHSEVNGSLVVVYVGTTPILSLGPDDAALAGEPSASVVAAAVETRIADALAAERKRSAIATTVFSLSLVVFSALIAFLVLRRLDDLAGTLRARFRQENERMSGIRIGDVELLSAGASRGFLSAVITLGYRLFQLALVYGWLVFALSLFATTRPYTARLTGFVIEPIGALALRVGESLPIVVVLAIAAAAMSILVRFAGLFFESVAFGKTHLEWLPPELARPVSVLVRAGIVIAGVVFGSPLLTGAADGALARAGMVVFVSLALSMIPVLASAAIGTVLIFGRRVRHGEHVEIGAHSGRVVEVGLLDTKLADGAGCELRVPHFYTLTHAIRHHGFDRKVSLDLVLASDVEPPRAMEVMLAAARELSPAARVEVLRIDAAGAAYRVTSTEHAGSDGALIGALTAALRREGIGWGSARGGT